MAKERVETKATPVADVVMTPTEMIRHDIVALAKETTTHYKRAEYEDSDKHMFYATVKVLSIRLEPYTPLEVRRETFAHYKELKEIEEQIKANATYSESTKKQTVLKRRYDYSLPIFEQNLRILQNSPLVEIEVEGLLNLADEEAIQQIQLDYRTGTSAKAKQIRVREETFDEGDEIEGVPD
jgi:hypothetical protein